MDYREFVHAVVEHINRSLTGDVQAELYTAEKNNGTEKTGILIESPGINISPTIYLEEYYKSYLQGRPLAEITGELLEFYYSIRREESWDSRKILTYEGVKERIVFKLVNTAKNHKFLSTVPHLGFLDLSVVFYVLLEATEEGAAALVVGNEHMRRWKVHPDILWEDAVKNSKKLLPAEFFTMDYALREMEGGGIGKEAESGGNLFLENTGSEDGMYILSNSLRNYGAACIAYPNVMEMIGRILCTDYYVLPSSVHEVVIVPCLPGITCKDLNRMVRDINETQVAEEEVLSSHAYIYERKTGKLRTGTGQTQAGGN